MLKLKFSLLFFSYSVFNFCSEPRNISILSEAQLQQLLNGTDEQMERFVDARRAARNITTVAALLSHLQQSKEPLRSTVFSLWVKNNSQRIGEKVTGLLSQRTCSAEELLSGVNPLELNESEKIQYFQRNVWLWQLQKRSSRLIGAPCFFNISSAQGQVVPLKSVLFVVSQDGLSECSTSALSQNLLEPTKFKETKFVSDRLYDRSPYLQQPISAARLADNGRIFILGFREMFLVEVADNRLLKIVSKRPLPKLDAGLFATLHFGRTSEDLILFSRGSLYNIKFNGEVLSQSRDLTSLTGDTFGDGYRAIGVHGENLYIASITGRMFRFNARTLEFLGEVSLGQDCVQPIEQITFLEGQSGVDMYIKFKNGNLAVAPINAVPTEEEVFFANGVGITPDSVEFACKALQLQ